VSNGLPAAEPMMSERKKRSRRIMYFALTGAVLFLLVAGTLLYLYYQNQMRGRAYCAGGLRGSLHLACVYYSGDHNALPPTLERLFGEYLPDDAIFACPGASKSREGGRMDYLYIDWSKQLRGTNWPLVGNTSGNYPMVYDRRLSNHGGCGIVILMTDCSTVWDRDARWLQEFAKKHPEVKVPLPEDIGRQSFFSRIFWRLADPPPDSPGGGVQPLRRPKSWD